MFNIIIFKAKLLLSKALVTIADLFHTLVAFKKKLVISNDIKIMFNIIIFKAKLLLSKALMAIADLFQTLFGFQEEVGNFV